MPPPKPGPEPADWPPYVSPRSKWTPAQYTVAAIAALGALISCVFLFTSLTGSVSTHGLTDDYFSSTPDEVSSSPLPSTQQAPATPAQSALESVSMSVLSTPSLATVRIEFDSVGVTPMTASIPQAGSYLLTISKSGYATLDTVVTVRPGDHPLYRIKLRSSNLAAIKGTDRAALETDRPPAPRRAATLRNRRSETAAPLTPPSSQQEPRAERTAPDESTEPSSRPEAAPTEVTGTLEILVRPWGTIYINGELHRSDTDMLYSVQLPPGSHEVRVIHPSLGRSQRTVRVSPDSKERLIFSLDG